MKKVASIIIVFIMVIAPITAHAEDGTPWTKLGSGLLNTLDAVVEVPGTMIRTGQTEGAANALTKGVLMGVLNTGVRLLAGAYEVVTFPFPIPADYEPVMKDAPQFLSTN